MTITEPYSMFPNRITDGVLSGSFTKNEIKVILFIARHTFGFHTEKQALSESFIAKGTKICKRWVHEAIQNLLKRNVLVEIKAPTPTQPRELKISSSFGVIKCSSGDETVTSPDDETVTSPGDEIVTQENKTIKNKTLNKRFSTSRSGIITDGFDVEEFYRAALEKRGL